MQHLQATQLYRYQLLPNDKRYVRLLKLRPDEDQDNPLSGELESVDLASVPKQSYFALSYVWGAEDDPATILLGDGVLLIRRNCSDALRHIRHKTNDVIIWVDSICINQEDKDEKMAQVSLMYEIYSGAEETMIWLGNASDSSDRALNWLEATGIPGCLFETEPRPIEISKRLHRHYYKAYTALRIWWDRKKTFWIKSKEPEPESQTSGHSDFHRYQYADTEIVADVSALLQNPWIDRIWTYQEIMLSNRPILIQGRKRISWESFCMGILTMEHTDKSFIGEGRRIHNCASLGSWIMLMLDRERYIYATKRNSKLTIWSRPSERVRSGLHEYRSIMLTIRSRQRKVLGEVLSIVSLIIYSVLTRVREKKSDHAVWIFLAVVSYIFILSCQMSIKKHEKFWLLDETPNLQHEAFAGVVYAALTRAATNSKDFYFGTRSFVQKLLEKDRQNSTLTYDNTDADTYKALTRDLLCAPKAGQLLVTAANKSAEGCPSWVPDWPRKWEESQILLDKARWHWHVEGATKGSKMDFELDEDRPDILKVRGVIIATVQQIYNEVSEIEDEQKIVLAKRAKKESKPFISSFVQNWFNPHDIHDRHRQRRDFQHELDALNPGWFRGLFHAGEPAPTPQLDSYIESEKPVPAEDWVMFGASRSREDNAEDRSVWDTGFARRGSVQTSDKIVLLSGVSIPIIVRPVQAVEGALQAHEYRLVSPARMMHEAMSGKYWDNKLWKRTKYEYLNIH